MTLQTDRRVPDSIAQSWVDRAPAAIRPYLRLARMDRPVGYWLLCLPCWFGLLLARQGQGLGLSDVIWMGLYFLGSLAMRGAGCTYNDIVDRDLDAQVARTADRPLAAGTVSLKQAWAFLLGQVGLGFLIFLALPLFAKLVALFSLALVAAYPFMKRITWWPQVWLGLTFNWGLLIAYSAVTGEITPSVLLLYAGAILWTLGYDTIYAHQDAEDDAMVGIKSSALALGDKTKPALWLIYALSAALTAAGVILEGTSLIFALVYPLYVLHLLSQIVRFDIHDGGSCLKVFKDNRTTGLLLVFALSLGALAPI
ncbi:4-hydroxybenzoate octaprenyltransferase [Woodsholea maritima]|uniref:4-hydroxybenzoate octaprenyltransferase n=1 Tax=Woodsholea maritima TaxID=240237 RepID=UPI00037EBACA|nr:4-hydroxybenzoate octaprenyltransferase [Woodsholea maritima]